MATAAEVATKVLAGLRRSATFDPANNNYHLLILQFINQAMNEAQEAWDWQVLRKTITVTGVGSQSVYTLDTAGESDVDLGPEAKLLYEKTRGGATSGETFESTIRMMGAQPQLWDTTVHPQFRLEEVAPEAMERLHQMDDNVEHEKPSKFTIYRDNDDMFMRVHPTPSGVRTWQGRFLDPQIDILSTDTFANIVMQVPIRPIWMKALWYALIERGEDRDLEVLLDQVNYALASFIALERSDEDDTGYPV